MSESSDRPKGKIVYPPAVPVGAGPEHEHEWQWSNARGVYICRTCGDDYAEAP